MLNDLLRPQNCQDPPLRTILPPKSSLAPNIPQIPIPAPRPLRSPGILDIKPAVERHALRRTMGPVHSALALVPHRRRVGLAGQQHGVHVGIAGGDGAVGDEKDEERREACRVDVPLADQVGQASVDAVEETHACLLVLCGESDCVSCSSGRWDVFAERRGVCSSSRSNGFDRNLRKLWVFCFASLKILPRKPTRAWSGLLTRWRELSRRNQPGVSEMEAGGRRLLGTGRKRQLGSVPRPTSYLYLGMLHVNSQPRQNIHCIMLSSTSPQPPNT